MRFSLLGLPVVLLGACAIDDAAQPESHLQSDVTVQTVLTTNGRFAGQYVVPAPAPLAAAATFYVPRVEWRVGGGTVQLRYDLPVGLVGGELSVRLSGPITSGATTVQLTGSIGRGTCTASGTVIRCSETLRNLGTLPISRTVIEARARAEYPGPVSDRVAVASIFSSDPIGAVSFDVTHPALDDDEDTAPDATDR